MTAACGAAGGGVIGAEATVVGVTSGAGMFGVDVAGAATVLGDASATGVVVVPAVGGSSGVLGPHAASRASSKVSIKKRCIRYPFALYDGFLA